MKKTNQHGGWKVPLSVIQGGSTPPLPTARVIAPTITLMTGMFADNTAIDESLHYAFAHEDFAEIDVASYAWSVTNLTHPANNVSPTRPGQAMCLSLTLQGTQQTSRYYWLGAW
ncbi:MAG: hypothetical protein IPN94_02430 [Sphingobacteriales bacterium]|nr:hypothetical protein [Sphingobacteriales bacterium]